MTLSAPTLADFRWKKGEYLDARAFDRRFGTIISFLAVMAEELTRQGASTDQIIELGLARVNEVLTPLLVQLDQAAELGFLIGVSTSELTLTEGMEPTFEINEATRTLFKPTPYLTISRGSPGAEDQFAIAKLITYVPETGGLSVEILSLENITGTHDDWIISASSALPLSVSSRLDSITTLAAQVATDRDAVEAALETVSSSVLTVAGKTGNVLLALGDVSGLLSALAGKADNGHGHAGSDITSGIIPAARLGSGTASNATVLYGDNVWRTAPGGGGATWSGISGDITQQLDLMGLFALKAALDHDHVIGDITGLQTTLDGKSNNGHGHTIPNVSGLQAALDDKQPLNSTLTTWAGRTPPSSTVVGTSDAQTLTNKRITKRVSSAATASSLVWNSDTHDVFILTALASGLTLPVDSGTPTEGQTAVFRIKDNGTQRSITWTTTGDKSFRALGVTLPANTTVGKELYVGCMYNAVALRWDVLSINQQA